MTVAKHRALLLCLAVVALWITIGTVAVAAESPSASAPLESPAASAAAESPSPSPAGSPELGPIGTPGGWTGFINAGGQNYLTVIVAIIILASGFWIWRSNLTPKYKFRLCIGLIALAVFGMTVNLVGNTQVQSAAREQAKASFALQLDAAQKLAEQGKIDSANAARAAKDAAAAAAAEAQRQGEIRLTELALQYDSRVQSCASTLESLKRALEGKLAVMENIEAARALADVMVAELDAGMTRCIRPVVTPSALPIPSADSPSASPSS